MKKSIALVVFVLIVVIAALGFVKFQQIYTLIQGGKNKQQPPSAVSSFTAEKNQWQQTLATIGSLEAAEGLVITADQSGRIAKIHFDAGSEVNKGDLLIDQDTSTEQARLRAAQSAAVLANRNLTRIRALYQQKVASKSEFDTAQNNYRSANAEVDNLRAVIERKSIRAPFSGRLGIRQVNLGQTINAGQPVVSLQATNKMFANFFLPQQELSKVATGMRVKLSTDAIPGKIFEGTISTIAPEIDVATRSVKLQAILDNSNNELLPGMFASITIILPAPKEVLMIPIMSVQYSTFGDSVFVIEPAPEKSEADAPADSPQSDEAANQAESPNADDSSAKPGDNSADNDGPSLIVRQQFVKLGEKRGDFVSVIKGIREGDKVVSAGGFKLQKNASVFINNSTVPDFQLEPTVDDN